jgi:hypothetical protein
LNKNPKGTYIPNSCRRLLPHPQKSKKFLLIRVPMTGCTAAPSESGRAKKIQKAAFSYGPAERCHQFDFLPKNAIKTADFRIFSLMFSTCYLQLTESLLRHSFPAII